MMYLYEAIIAKVDEPQFKGYQADFPDLGRSTCGATLEEVAFMASDLLRTEASFALSEGKILPKATFGHKAPKGEVIMLVSAQVTKEEALQEFSQKEAVV